MVSFDYAPTINYTTLTLGDLLGLSALLTICCAQICWCCHHHRSRRKKSQPHQKIKKKNHKNHQIHILLKKIDVQQVDDEKQIEFKPLCRKSIKDAMVKYDEDEDNAAPSLKQNDSYRRDSISGPMKGSAPYTVFIITLILMIIAGSGNDFLGKLTYQIYPGNIGTLNGLEALKYEYWLTFALTIGSFFVCMFALFTPSASSSFHKLDTKLFLKISIPSIMDVVVTGGRYLALVFMPAALISLLKNGSQLIFLAWLRRILHEKKLLSTEWFGIGIIIIGLLIVAINKMYASVSDVDSMMTPMDSAVGISLMIGLGFSGAIRNDIEEVLLKNDDLDSNFVVGLESFISLTVTVILSIVLFIIDPFNNINEENIWKDFEKNVLMNPLFILIFILFLIAIFVKDTMQMKLTFLSSSLTRKLFQQLYPSVTWFISLTTFAMHCVFFEKDENGKHTYDISHKDRHEYGESWEGKYSWIRLTGFIIVVIGSLFYIKGHFIFQKCSDLMLI